MGGRGGASGLGRGGAKPLPELTGSEKQVKWAKDIRQSALDTISSNLKNEKEYYSKFKDFESKMKIELYKDLQEAFQERFQNITKASQIIDMRNNISPSNIVNMVNSRARDMNMQHINGWVYDPKKKKMVKK